jgi:hypothetical protein
MGRVPWASPPSRPVATGLYHPSVEKANGPPVPSGYRPPARFDRAFGYLPSTRRPARAAGWADSGQFAITTQRARVPWAPAHAAGSATWPTEARPPGQCNCLQPAVYLSGGKQLPSRDRDGRGRTTNQRRLRRMPERGPRLQRLALRAPGGDCGIMARRLALACCWWPSSWYVEPGGSSPTGQAQMHASRTVGQDASRRQRRESTLCTL